MLLKTRNYNDTGFDTQEISGPHDIIKYISSKYERVELKGLFLRPVVQYQLLDDSKFRQTYEIIAMMHHTPAGHRFTQYINKEIGILEELIDMEVKDE